MNDCKDLELLVSLRASGAPDALDSDAAARLDAHLATCAACRADLDASAAALSLARLPPPSDAERRAVVRDLPARALAALHAKDRRRGLSRRVLAGAAAVAVAAGLAAAVFAPAFFQKTPQVQVTFAEQAVWQEPDLDDLYDDAQVVDLETSVQVGGDGAEAALAALEL